MPRLNVRRTRILAAPEDFSVRTEVRSSAMIWPECGPGLFNSAERHQVLRLTGSNATHPIHRRVASAG